MNVLEQESSAYKGHTSGNSGEIIAGGAALSIRNSALVPEARAKSK
jgi:hypothetical protein